VPDADLPARPAGAGEPGDHRRGHHYTTKNSYQKVLDRFPGAVVIGVTATPWRLDGQGPRRRLRAPRDRVHAARAPRPRLPRGVGGWEYEGIDTSRPASRAATSWRRTSRRPRPRARRRRHRLGVAGARGGARSVLFATSVEHSQLMVEEFQKARASPPSTSTARWRPPSATRSSRGSGAARRGRVQLQRAHRGVRLPGARGLHPRAPHPLHRAVPADGRPRAPAGRGQDAGADPRPRRLPRAHGHPYAERDYSPQLSAQGRREGGGEADAGGQAVPQLQVGDRPVAVRRVRVLADAEGAAARVRPEAAAKREITNDGSGAEAVEEGEDAERQEVWRTQFAFDEERAAALLRPDGGEARRRRARGSTAGCPEILSDRSKSGSRKCGSRHEYEGGGAGQHRRAAPESGRGAAPARGGGARALAAEPPHALSVPRAAPTRGRPGARRADLRGQPSARLVLPVRDEAETCSTCCSSRAAGRPRRRSRT
jgi:hypothetical protein